MTATTASQEGFLDKPLVKTIARSFLGLMMFVFGLNGFLGFIPMPAPPEAAGAFLGALAGTGYFFPLLKVTEILVGVALLANVFTPLALTVLAPISINIVAFHIFLDPAGGMAAYLVFALNIFLAIIYKDSFKEVLKLKA